MKKKMGYIFLIMLAISLASTFLPVVIKANSELFASKKNKIVYMISPPRSLSVAFLRMMESRGDFKVMNEPSQWAWCSIDQYEKAKKWFKKDAPKTFDEVKKIIFNKAQTSNVFVKEMSFAVKDFLVQDTELLKKDSVYFVFLVRNPHHSVVSFYKKQQLVCKGLEEDELTNLMGYKELYEAFKHIKAHAIHVPCIVLSEDLYLYPERTLKALFDFLVIPFKKSALEWTSLTDNFLGETWDEIKPKNIMQTWHDDAIKSSGFQMPSIYKVDNDGRPTFEEVVNLEHRAICKNAYKKNLYFYNKLLEEDAFIIKP